MYKANRRSGPDQPVRKSLASLSCVFVLSLQFSQEMDYAGFPFFRFGSEFQGVVQKANKG